ncbi:MAG: SDR family NAD(P)-dependent oxidoreductase [Gammaproteobacteria bacterium]|nr:SDR family NAD(P)-dependent oxidoreductase [Gammaproteobacteria bacterium]
MSDFVFDRRVAIVTGAGGGLGRAYALELARRGARVVVNDLGGAVDGVGGGAAPADGVVKEIEAAGGEAVANYDSVATPEGGAAIVQTALDEYGTVDILINNAGILRDRSFAKLETSDLKAVLAVHLEGAFYVTQRAFRAMKEQGYGRLVFASSNAGILGNFGQSNYGAAKMGLVGLSNVLAIEGAKYNIKSNVIAPLARTRMTEDLLGPLAELMDPEQVAAMVVYLASEECAFTHEIFSAGGGRYARFFVGATKGWFAGAGVVPSVEEVATHLDEIRDTDGFQILGQISEEIGLLLRSLRGEDDAD